MYLIRKKFEWNPSEKKYHTENGTNILQILANNSLLTHLVEGGFPQPLEVYGLIWFQNNRPKAPAGLINTCDVWPCFQFKYIFKIFEIIKQIFVPPIQQWNVQKKLPGSLDWRVFILHRNQAHLQLLPLFQLFKKCDICIATSSRSNSRVPKTLHHCIDWSLKHTEN